MSRRNLLMRGGGRKQGWNFSTKKRICCAAGGNKNGGGTGIRTLGEVAPATVFETVPFSRSGIPPLAAFLPAKRLAVKQDN
jgi:hypothetical protein